ncbi:MAG: hypothetical protein P0121_02115 [Nitrospira sp.]|nr:hypothetical protein [Nitrospira sp.]
MTWTRPQRPPWMDQATYTRMPQQLTVRQIEVAGPVLVTTLADKITLMLYAQTCGGAGHHWSFLNRPEASL